MRCIALLCLLGAVNAAVRPPMRALGPRYHAVQRAHDPHGCVPGPRARVVAFGGDDKFLEAAMDANGFAAKLGSPVAKLAVQGLTVAAAAGGWFFAPTVRPVAKGVCAAAAGGVGLFARSRLMKARRRAAMSVLAKVLSSKGVSNVKPEEVQGFASSYGVPEKEFNAQLAELYAIFLSGCIRNPVPRTSELSELLTLQRSFKLNFEVVGDATLQAATRFYSEARAYFEADEDNDAKRRLDKLVFLADRTLAEDPSEEGYRYERTRIGKRFGMDDEEWYSRVERVARPFYVEVLATVAQDPSAFSARDLDAVGRQLGLADDVMTEMKMEDLRRYIATSLEASGNKFTASQLEKHRTIAQSYGLPDDKAREVIEAVVGPAYAKAVAEVIAEIEAAPEVENSKLLGRLALRQQELDMSPSGTEPVPGGVPSR